MVGLSLDDIAGKTSAPALLRILLPICGHSGSNCAFDLNEENIYQSGQIIELVYNDKQSVGLRRIKEVTLHPDSPILLDIIAQQLCFFYTELISLSLEDAHTDLELFDFIKKELCDSLQKSQHKYAPIRFVLGLCSQLGYQIDADVHFPHLDGVKLQLKQIMQGEDPGIDRHTRRILLNRLVERLQIEAFPEKSVYSLRIIDELLG